MITRYSTHSSCPPLSLALSLTAPQPREDERVYVSLKGETSKVIWPMLMGVMRWRFGMGEGQGEGKGSAGEAGMGVKKEGV